MDNKEGREYGYLVASTTVTMRNVFQVHPAAISDNQHAKPQQDQWRTEQEGTPRRCAACLKGEADDPRLSLKRCSQCRVTWYCSAACQKKDWKTHKASCAKQVAQEGVLGTQADLDLYTEYRRKGLPYPAANIQELELDDLLLAWEQARKGDPAVTTVAHHTSRLVAEQIVDLCCQINSERFPDLSDKVCMSDQMGVADQDKDGGARLLCFGHELTLAYQLLLRIDVKGWTWLTAHSDPRARCATPKVAAALMLARSWTHNVAASRTRSNPALVSITSAVAAEQGVGVMMFAEQLRWPYIQEARVYLSQLRSPSEILQNGPSAWLLLWDWLHGLVKPGAAFSFTIMTSLVLLTPQLHSQLAAPATQHVGLVLGQCAYWRNTTPMGRVMGGLKNTRSAAGWLGPCPVPLDGAFGWVRNEAKHVFPRSFHYLEDWKHHRRDPSVPRMRQGEDPMAYIADLEDHSKYVVPELPGVSHVDCYLVSTRLENLAAGKISVQSGPLNFRARLVFEVGGKTVEYSLETVPTFVSAHPCLKGPHRVHERQLSDYDNVWQVEQLKLAPHPEAQDKTMIINATNGDGETLARAWCAEVGANAVIRREGVTDACLVCAERLASEVTLGLLVLIWS